MKLQSPQSGKGGKKMSRAQYFILALLLIAATGCSSANKQTIEQQPQATPQQQADVQPQQHQENVAPQQPQASIPAQQQHSNVPPQQKQVPPAQPESQVQKTATTAPRAAAEPPAVIKAPEPRYATLPAGTVITVRLQEALDSGVNKTGDPFTAIVDKDLNAGDTVVVPRGSTVDGKLTLVDQSGRVSGRAAVSLQLLKLHVENQAYSVQTETLAFEADSTKKKDAAKVGIGAGVGAAIGAIAGGGKGAAIGAVVGGGAGTATVLATKGKEVKFQPEHPLSFKLSQDVTIKLP
jgi:hypothetical protein